MERIRSAGKTSVIAKLADRVREGRSVTVDNPSEVNVVPYTVIEPVNTVGRVIVKNDDDFVLLDEDVEVIEVIEVKNGVCNNEAFEDWEMGEYVRLRELIVGGVFDLNFLNEISGINAVIFMGEQVQWEVWH